MPQNKRHLEFYALPPYPVQFAVIQDEIALKAFYKHLKVPSKKQMFSTDTCQTFIFGKINEEAAWLALYFPNKELGLSVLVHECMHIVQQVWEMIGETKRGLEAEAYLLQGVFEIAHDIIFGEGIVDENNE